MFPLLTSPLWHVRTWFSLECRFLLNSCRQSDSWFLLGTGPSVRTTDSPEQSSLCAFCNLLSRQRRGVAQAQALNQRAREGLHAFDDPSWNLKRNVPPLGNSSIVNTDLFQGDPLLLSISRVISLHYFQKNKVRENVCQMFCFDDGKGTAPPPQDLCSSSVSYWRK